jgi:DNA-binding transcriptional LysR family regulator
MVLTFAESKVIYQGLLQGDWELGIITLNPDPQPQLQQQSVWQDTMHFVAAPNHPLAQLSQVSPEQLSQYSALLPKPNTFTRYRLSLNVGMSTNHLDTIRMMVRLALIWAGMSYHKLCSTAALSISRCHPGPSTANWAAFGIGRHSLSNAAKSFLDMVYSQFDHLASKWLVYAVYLYSFSMYLRHV